MITGAMIVTKYGDSTKERRLDMICKYYPCFLEIVDSFIEDMEDDIRNEQDYNIRLVNYSIHVGNICRL